MCLTLYVAAHIQFACRRWFLRPVWTGVNQVGAQATDMGGLEQVGTAICNNSQFQYRDARQGTIYVFRTNQEIAACSRLDRCNGSCAMCGVLMQADGSQRCRGCLRSTDIWMRTQSATVHLQGLCFQNGQPSRVAICRHPMKFHDVASSHSRHSHNIATALVSRVLHVCCSTRPSDFCHTCSYSYNFSTQGLWCVPLTCIACPSSRVKRDCVPLVA